MNIYNFNVNRFGVIVRRFFWIGLILLNAYTMVLVVRQAMADFLFSKAVHKGLPGLVEKLFSFSNQYPLQEKIDMLTQAIRINPNHPEYYHELGKLYLKLGESDLNSNSTQLTIYRLAIENFEKSIIIDPVDPITQLYLANANFHISHSLNELIGAAKKIEKIDPYNKILAKIL